MNHSGLQKSDIVPPVTPLPRPAGMPTASDLSISASIASLRNQIIAAFLTHSIFISIAQVIEFGEIKITIHAGKPKDVTVLLRVHE